MFKSIFYQEAEELILFLHQNRTSYKNPIFPNEQVIVDTVEYYVDEIDKPGVGWYAAVIYRLGEFLKSFQISAEEFEYAEYTLDTPLEDLEQKIQETEGLIFDPNINFELKELALVLILHFKLYGLLEAKYNQMFESVKNDQPECLFAMLMLVGKIEAVLQDESLSNGQFVYLLEFYHLELSDEYCKNEFRLLHELYKARQKDALEQRFSFIANELNLSELAYQSTLHLAPRVSAVSWQEVIIHKVHVEYAQLLLSDFESLDTAYITLPNIIAGSVFILNHVEDVVLQEIDFDKSVESIILRKLKLLSITPRIDPPTLDLLKYEIDQLAKMQDASTGLVLKAVLRLKLKREKSYIHLLAEKSSDEQYSADDLRGYALYTAMLVTNKALLPAFDQYANAAIRDHDFKLLSFAQHKAEQLSWVAPRKQVFDPEELDDYLQYPSL